MSEPALAAWAREEAFPKKPDEGPYGSFEKKGKIKAFQSLDELKAHLSSGKGRLAWVWVPEHEHLIAPEEVPALSGVLKKRRLLFAQEDEDEARKTLPFTGILLAYAGFSVLRGGRPFGYQAFEFLVIMAFAALYFTARPWWESYKAKKEVGTTTRATMAAEIPEARFDLWMGSQRSWLSVILLGAVAIVGLTQSFTPHYGIQEAGLVKERYKLGETWRLFTAAFMHGNLIHFFLNASAFWYLGRRLEILARWPHLAAVFLLSIIGAGLATVSWMPTQTSVGVSGVVCGLLGFLLVFETLHKALVPRPARRRLSAILLSLIVIGLIGFKFIDNAAHFGGLLTGAAYAFIVFPKSSSPHRPIILKRDYIVAGVSLLCIALSALGAVLAMSMISR